MPKAKFNFKTTTHNNCDRSLTFNAVRALTRHVNKQRKIKPTNHTFDVGVRSPCQAENQRYCIKNSDNSQETCYFVAF